MKLKGITKLVLAGTALAATAATLTTSTYAWYVTNNKVEATNISGATAGDSVAGSLLISQLDSASAAKLPLNYTTAINLSSDVTATALTPQTLAEYALTDDVALDSNKTYYTKSGNEYTAVETPDVDDIASYYEKNVFVDAEGNIIDGTFVTFSFWLKASENMNGVKINTKFANTANAAVLAEKKQTLYAGTGIPTGKNQYDTFVVDSVYALRMEVTQQAYTIVLGEDGNDRDKNADTKTATGDPTVTAVGAVENHNATNTSEQYASPTYDVSGTPTAIFDDWEGGDANIYYKTIMGHSGFGTDATTGASVAQTGTWTTLNLAKDVDNLVTIRIWLEGTDAQCYDSCVGQNFSLNLKFEKAGS